VINVTHWLGALITSYKMIGSGYSPVRAVIDRAASYIEVPKLCFALVVTYEGLAGLFVGSPEEAWQAAADLSSQVHVIYVDRPYRRVLSVMPRMYDDLWTAAKGMYKMEPAIADGGEVVIYAPHINEISYTHGKIIDRIGYHVRDYFVKQWDRFKDEPWGVLAHSTIWTRQALTQVSGRAVRRRASWWCPKRGRCSIACEARARRKGKLSGCVWRLAGQTSEGGMR